MHLDSLPIQRFDEAFFALRADHIADNGLPLKDFNHYTDRLEHPNAKPPLFSYIQAASFNLLGFNELALRLPVAISGVLTCLFLVFILNRYYAAFFSGCFAALILATSPGYLDDHMARFGDQDVPFALLSFLTVFYYFQFIQHRKVYHLIVSIAFLIAAFLIKSVAAFLILPGMFVFTLFRKESRNWVKNNSKWLLIAFLGVLLPIVLILVFYKDEIVLGLENYERLFIATEEYHRHYFWYYFDVWNVKGEFRPWIILLPLSLFPILFDNEKKPFILYLWTVAGLHWLVISIAQTKINHYAAPLFVIHAVIAGMTLAWFFKYLSVYFLNRYNVKPIMLFFIFSFVVFYFPYKNVMDDIVYKNDVWKFHNYGLFLKRNPDYKKVAVIYDGVNLSNTFYIHVRNEHQGYEILEKSIPDKDIKPKMAVISCDEADIKWIEDRFKVRTIDEKRGCKMIWLERKK